MRFFQVGGKTVIFSIIYMLAFFGNSSLSAATKQVLLLHDSHGQWGHLGDEYAIMVKNLLGHFDVNITTKPVSSYSSGEINRQDATFYIGSTYDEKSFLKTDAARQLNYQNFLKDAATTTKPVAWINHNLEDISRHWNPAWGAATFSEKMGFNYIGIKNTGFNRVQYKGVELHKGVISWANPGSDFTGCTEEGGTAYACSTRLHTIVITDPAKAKVKATAYSTLNPNNPQEPYITRSGNFWFIGDMPLSFISEEDRYLAFADIIHDIIGSGIGQQPLKAMVRLEDISPGIDPVTLKEVMTYLDTQNVPFAIAAVSIFLDPKGILSNGTPKGLALPNSKIARTIAPFYNKGRASIVAHGLTHQFGNLDNPYNSLSGDDFEFYRVTINSDNSLNFLGAVPNDSSQWARNRMRVAKILLRFTRFEAFAWEAPHYFATDADNRGIKSVFSTHYGRAVYFNNSGPAGRHTGQFFPYVINSDHYGYRQIPENIGNIEPTPFLGYRPLLPADLLRHAEKMKVVRDGIASFFYHPYLGTTYLNEVVQGLKKLGYQFIAPCSLAANSCPSGNTGETALAATSGESLQSAALSEGLEQGSPETAAIAESASGTAPEYTGEPAKDPGISGYHSDLYGDSDQVQAQAAADGNSSTGTETGTGTGTSTGTGQITIDGIFDDWAGHSAFSDSPSDGGTVNWSNAWTDSSNGKLSFSYQNVGNLDQGALFRWNVYLDTDKNSATGYNFELLGGDYLVQGNNLYQYTGTGKDWSWKLMQTADFKATGDRAEFSILKSTLGLADNADSYRALFYGYDADGSKLDYLLIDVGAGQGSVVEESITVPGS